MRVRELMTEQVLTIGPEAPIKDVAKVLVDNGISGLPVCDIECRVLGVISEGDILYKEHDPREGHIGGPLRWIIDGTPNYAGYVKADALTAGKAMTTPAITIPPYESVAEAARIMCELGVNRLPVVKDERLVGIITRSDLVRAFTRSDEDIAREIREDVLHRIMWIDTGKVEAVVQRGRAVLTGRLNTRSDVEHLAKLVRRIPGVTSVESQITWNVDDSTRKGRRSLEQPVR